jgi:ATP/maltotriose-dependent transcriptional regulator MalT
LNTKEKQFLEHLVQILQGRDTGTGIRNGKGNDTGHSDDNDDRNRIGAIEEALLTDRELEVLQVLVTGATNKQIAETLCISVATVKTHIIHIYTKLEVSNRVEALEKARSLKLC